MFLIAWLYSCLDINILSATKKTTTTTINCTINTIATKSRAAITPIYEIKVGRNEGEPLFKVPKQKDASSA